jgi:hypothetical protein
MLTPMTFLGDALLAAFATEYERIEEIVRI